MAFLGLSGCELRDILKTLGFHSEDEIPDHLGGELLPRLALPIVRVELAGNLRVVQSLLHGSLRLRESPVSGRMSGVGDGCGDAIGDSWRDQEVDDCSGVWGRGRA